MLCTRSLPRPPERRAPALGVRRLSQTQRPTAACAGRPPRPGRRAGGGRRGSPGRRPVRRAGSSGSGRRPRARAPATGHRCRRFATRVSAGASTSQRATAAVSSHARRLPHGRAARNHHHRYAEHLPLFDDGTWQGASLRHWCRP